MAGLLGKLFGGAGPRPVIRPEVSADPAKLNDVVDWFISHEEGVRRHISPVLNSLVWLGYVPSSGFADDPLTCADSVEWSGIRNRTTFGIWTQLEPIRGVAGDIDEPRMRALLTNAAEELQDTVLQIRECDPSGRATVELLQLCAPVLQELATLPDPTTAIPRFRGVLDRFVFNQPDRRLLAALMIQKGCAEVAFYIMCWLYYNWYGRQFNAPGLPEKRL